MRVTYRPIGTDWRGDRTSWHKDSPFRRAGKWGDGGLVRAGGDMPWSDTMVILDRELVALGAEEVIFQLDMPERDIRLDGMPRADARASSAVVIISFKSRHGWLRYQCDTFEPWQANVRAIALGLEALRKVDRYGISRRGEQYAGWTSLPEAGKSDTQVEALAFLRERSPQTMHDSPQRMYRAVAMQLHPDQGGDRAEWDRLQRAKAVLGI